MCQGHGETPQIVEGGGVIETRGPSLWLIAAAAAWKGLASNTESPPPKGRDRIKPHIFWKRHNRVTGLGTPEDLPGLYPEVHMT